LVAGFRRGTIDDLASDGGFAGEFAVDGCAAFHFRGVGTPREDGDFDAQLVAGHDGLAELGALDAGEDHELLVSIGDLGKEKCSSGLSDGFDDEDAGHDRVTGKVSCEMRLVYGDVLDGDDALATIDLDDAVDEKERVAMRKNALDLENVENGFSRGSGIGYRIGDIGHESLVGRGNYSSPHSAVNR
jgi:hypothetical protein